MATGDATVGLSLHQGIGAKSNKTVKNRSTAKGHARQLLVLMFIHTALT
jgi:hypothetical protein